MPRKTRCPFSSIPRNSPEVVLICSGSTGWGPGVELDPPPPPDRQPLRLTASTTADSEDSTKRVALVRFWLCIAFILVVFPRSEEHTSELQSRPHLVCRLLLEKKKK